MPHNNDPAAPMARGRTLLRSQSFSPSHFRRCFTFLRHRSCRTFVLGALRSAPGKRYAAAGKEKGTEKLGL